MSGEETTILSRSPLFPLDVGHAKILVSLIDELSATRTEQSQRKVQMLSPGMEVLRTYEFGKDGLTPVLTAPFRLTQNYNSNVCFIDKYKTEQNDSRESIRLL